jgi:hypothetical protein
MRRRLVSNGSADEGKVAAWAGQAMLIVANIAVQTTLPLYFCTKRPILNFTRQ